jgi:hypothetical protein
MYHFNWRTAKPLESLPTLGYDKDAVGKLVTKPTATSKPYVNVSLHTAPTESEVALTKY